MTKQDLKIVFFGTPDFAVASLDRLIKNGYNVAAVVTMPDKPAGRGRHIIQSDVKRYAVENNIPVLQPEKLKDEFGKSGKAEELMKYFKIDAEAIIEKVKEN